MPSSDTRRLDGGGVIYTFEIGQSQSQQYLHGTVMSEEVRSTEHVCIIIIHVAVLLHVSTRHTTYYYCFLRLPHMPVDQTAVPTSTAVPLPSVELSMSSLSACDGSCAQERSVIEITKLRIFCCRQPGCRARGAYIFHV